MLFFFVFLFSRGLSIRWMFNKFVFLVDIGWKKERENGKYLYWGVELGIRVVYF